jgi:hypothetical protein
MGITKTLSASQNKLIFLPIIMEITALSATKEFSIKHTVVTERQCPVTI